MSFFDTTPVGRIVNRFSKDMYTVDEQVVNNLVEYLWTLCSVLAVVVVISGVTPWFIVALCPLIAFYGKQQQFFTKSYRELKRLDSVSRSPLYALLGETLDGIATIRAFSAQDSLTSRIIGILNRQQTAYFLTFTAQCFLAVRLEVIGTSIIAFASLFGNIIRCWTFGKEVLGDVAVSKIWETIRKIKLTTTAYPPGQKGIVCNT